MDLPDTPHDLLLLLKDADNPTQVVSDLFDSCRNSDEDGRLRRQIKSLKDKGLISVPMWADNKPWILVLEKDASEGIDNSSIHVNISDSHDINIGAGACVNNSTVGSADCAKKGFSQRHPIVTSVLVSLAVGIVLLFSFWDQLVSFIEGLF